MGVRTTKSSKTVVSAKKLRDVSKASISAMKQKSSKVNVGKKTVQSFEKNSKLIAQKKKAQEDAKAKQLMSRKERADIDFATKKLTHKINDGKYKTFTGSVSKEFTIDGVAHVEFDLLCNARGKPIIEARSIILEESFVLPLSSDEMLDFANHIEGEEEDPEFVKFENLTWTCTKCSAAVKNDHGYCPEVIDGSICRGTQAPPQGGFIGWGSCFGNIVGSAQNSVSLYTPRKLSLRIIHCVAL